MQPPRAAADRQPSDRPQGCVAGEVGILHSVFAAIPVRRLRPDSEVRDLRQVLPDHLRSGRDPALRQLGQFKPCLRHLVPAPRHSSRRVDHQAVIEEELPVTGSRRDPPGAGRHVRELGIEPAFGAAAVADCSIGQVDRAANEARFAEESAGRTLGVASDRRLGVSRSRGGIRAGRGRGGPCGSGRLLRERVACCGQEHDYESEHDRCDRSRSIGHAGVHLPPPKRLAEIRHVPSDKEFRWHQPYRCMVSVLRRPARGSSGVRFGARRKSGRAPARSLTLECHRPRALVRGSRRRVDEKWWCTPGNRSCSVAGQWRNPLKRLANERQVPAPIRMRPPLRRWCSKTYRSHSTTTRCFTTSVSRLPGRA